eukprot:NODE_52_length_30984_cov_1.383358.p19 type:complete len:270 gc:universal NODE_52_length_30984_cov_1.383358:9360-10169(+)
MIIKLGSQKFEPEYVENNDDVWRITDKLTVEKGDKSYEVNSVDYGDKIYFGNDMKLYHSKPIQYTKVDLTALKESIDTATDIVDKRKLATALQVQYIGIPNLDAATPLDDIYYRDMHVFTLFKSELLAGACIGIEQLNKNEDKDNLELFGSTFRICHFFILKPFQNMGLGRQLYAEVKKFVNENFDRLCVEDPNELFCNLRDHCDLREVQESGGLSALLNRADGESSKRSKLDPISFVGKFNGIRNYISKLQSKFRLSPVIYTNEGSVS